MQFDMSSKGSVMPIVLGIGAIIILIGTVVLFSTEAPAEPVPITTENDVVIEEITSDTQADPTETRLAGDPTLDTLTPEELAADGPIEEPILTDSGLIIDADTEIDTTLLPEAQPGEFVYYADGTLAYAETGDVILFFHADWCPSCRALENDINANLSSIPDGVSIQKIDYDTATDLKKKYGVVRQHTLVQVDESGNLIKTLTGLTNTLDQVVGQI